MKIFSSSQIKACDAYTIHASKMKSIDLMERAANKCVDWLSTHLPKDALFIVLCGSGNNGGDGLAITRLLHQRGYGVKAFLLEINDEMTPDCNTNYERLKNIDNDYVEVLQEGMFVADIPQNVYIIDAILGTGLNRPVSGWLSEFIQNVNESENIKIAIDIPSGIPADNIPEGDFAAIMADHTISFQFYKRSFLHRETGIYTGFIHVLDIGLHPTFITATHTNYATIDTDAIGAIYKKRQPFSHKGDYGFAYLIAGSHGMIGAAILAVRAAFRAGAGKIKILLPECGYNIMQTAVPEAICTVYGEKYISRICDWENVDAIGIGPGLGTNENTARAFSQFIEECKVPVVIDADGLNLLAQRSGLLGKVPARSILTPHPKEFDNLFGKSANSMQRLERARKEAMHYNIYIVLKDRYTIVVTPKGDCWYNLTGNPGMATAGSGDVLTGIITGLLAQGYSSEQAAMMGVYIHGLAGDIASGKQSEEALVAGDIITKLGKAFRIISKY
ncbi:MAG: NAD(P)H-hydrate dehydratase [Flavipsychrobacter sp.]